MLTGYQIIWLLLPIFLFLLGIWAVVKPILGITGREPTLTYFKQGVFCLIAFFIALWIDNLESFEKLVASYSFWKFDLKVVRWLLYLIVLLLLALIQQYWIKRKEASKPKKDTPIRRR